MTNKNIPTIKSTLPKTFKVLWSHMVLDHGFEDDCGIGAETFRRMANEMTLNGLVEYMNGMDFEDHYERNEWTKLRNALRSEGIKI